MKKWLLCCSVSIVVASPASAECDPKSFFDNASVQSTEIKNLALAYNVTEGRWSSEKNNGGAGATIYGVPVNASFTSFKDSVRQKAVSLGYTNFEYQSVSIATTTLTSNNLNAYKSCLIAASPLSIVNEGGPSTSYKLSLQYSPAIGTTPTRGSVLGSQNLADADVQALRDRLASLNPGPFMESPILQASDPSKEATLQIGTAYHSASIVLAPLALPAPIAPPPPAFDVQRAHGGADVHVIINSSACQQVNYGSIGCGSLYAGRRSTATNAWYFGGHNAIRNKWTDGTYTNAPNDVGNLSLWGILLTYDGTGTVYRDGKAAGKITFAQ